MLMCFRDLKQANHGRVRLPDRVLDERIQHLSDFCRNRLPVESERIRLTNHQQRQFANLSNLRRCSAEFSMEADAPVSAEKK